MKTDTQGQHQPNEPEVPGNIATILQELAQSATRSDMPRRITLCKQALAQISRTAHPQLWAELQFQLASSLYQTPYGSRADNIEQAISLYQQALEVFTRSSFPEDWAMTQNNLAIAYSNRMRGERAENVEQAIYFYQQALNIYTRQSDPEHWSGTQNNLGSAYSNRIRGKRAENIEQAIFHYQQALEIRTRQSDPERWAMAQNNLANAYTKRIQGKRAENIEEAISHYQQALQVRTRQNLPDDWAITQNNLALAYFNRICGERVENIEKALHHYNLVLEVYTRQTYPADWAMVQHNLAASYRVRIRGERAENIEQAIFHYHQALEIRTHHSDPENWAMTQNNLANSYSDRIRGERAENIELAIHHYQQVLEVHTRQSDPESWALTQNNLAIAYSNRIYGEQAENIERAIYHYQQALEIRTRQAFPEYWAMTQNNLATAFVDRIRGERAENIEQSIFHYQQALEIYTRQAFPEDWAMTQNNLAVAYTKRVRGEHTEKITQAIYHYRQALEVSTLHTFPIECRQTSKSLGNLGFDEHDWIVALEGFRQALAAQEVLMRSTALRASKEVELREVQAVPARASYSHLKLGQVTQSLVVLEGGRARLMTEALERNRRDLERLAEIGQEKLLARYRSASQQIIALQRLGSHGENIIGRPADWQHQIEFALAEIQTVIAEIRQVPGYDRFQLSLTAKQIQEQAQNAPLVYLVNTSAGGFALIVTPENIHVIWLNELTDTILTKKLHGSVDNPIGGYLGAYINWQRAMLNSQKNRTAKRTATLFWQDVLDDITSWLWSAVMEKVVTSLKALKVQKAVLIPGGLLGLLPLHAAWKEDSTTISGRVYALDEISFRYAPNARALQEATEVAARSDTASILAIDNPDGTLTFSNDEVAAALTGFDSRIHLSGTQATHHAVLDALSNHTVLHFSTHGIAGWNEPLQSRLRLADSELSLGELLDQNLLGARLAVLSACETGVPGTKLPDEVVGLPVGLMQAGVAGVVASLWPVADISTAMLMTRFYELWRHDGYEVSESLWQAQIWLRDSTDGDKRDYFQSSLSELVGLRIPVESAEAFFRAMVLNDPEARSFAHPFYWAAFTYTGV